MLAIVAGTGRLPSLLKAKNPDAFVCALSGFLPNIAVDRKFEIENLGSLLEVLVSQGIRKVCFAGAIQRPVIDPGRIDAATLPLVPRLTSAIGQGDDGALRVVIQIFEDAGLEVIGAHELMPELVVPAGVIVGEVVPIHESVSQIHRRMSVEDRGQALVIARGQVVAEEGAEGTDAMMVSLGKSAGAILYKAPKTKQDLRVDMPTIGIDTAKRAAELSYLGIAIKAQQVIVLDRTDVIQICRESGVSLWAIP